MQMQHTKNLIPRRFELGTTLSQPIRAIEIITIRNIAEFLYSFEAIKINASEGKHWSTIETIVIQ